MLCLALCALCKVTTSCGSLCQLGLYLHCQNPALLQCSVPPLWCRPGTVISSWGNLQGGEGSPDLSQWRSVPACLGWGSAAQLMHTELVQGTGGGGSYSLLASHCPERLRGAIPNLYSRPLCGQRQRHAGLAQGTALPCYSHCILPLALGTLLTRVGLPICVPALQHLFSFPPPPFFWSCDPYPSKLGTQEGNRQEYCFCWRWRAGDRGTQGRISASPKTRWGKKGEPQCGKRNSLSKPCKTPVSL